LRYFAHRHADTHTHAQTDRYDNITSFLRQKQLTAVLKLKQDHYHRFFSFLFS